VLSFQGILVTHPVMTAINARVLCPGSNQETDKLLLDLIQLWHEGEGGGTVICRINYEGR
jgi:hypothetical protein